MNTKNIIKQALFIACILTIGATAGFGQGLFGKIKDRVESKVKEEATQPKRVFGVKTAPKAENANTDSAN